MTAAEDAYRQALRINPNLREALYGLGTILKGQGKMSQAKDYLQRVKSEEQQIIKANQAAALNADGISFMNRGQIDQALRAFQAALANDPTFALAAYNAGVVLARMGRNQDAVKAFRVAIQLKPGLAAAHFGLGLVLRQMGDPTAAAELDEAQLLNKFIPNPSGGGDQTSLESTY